MNKRTVLFIIAASLFGFAVLSLILAMGFHAYFSDGFVLASVVAGASAFASLLSVIFACLTEKGDSLEKHKD